jgi:hypothetical protein
LLASTALDGQVSAGGVALWHLALGVGAVGLVFLVARRWGCGRWSYLVALLLACDPILLNQSSLVMTETLATCLVLICLLLLTRFGRDAAWATAFSSGIAVGLATLCRPTFLIWLLLVVAWTVVNRAKRFGWSRVVMLLAGFCVSISPWVIRNQITLGRPIIATTHGGYTLLLGNNRPFYEHLKSSGWGTVWDARELLPLIESQLAQDGEGSPDGASEKGQGGSDAEVLADRRLYALAKQTIREDPTTFGYACLVRVARLWTPLPHQLSVDESLRTRLARWCVASWYFAVFLLALGGLWHLGRQLRSEPWGWGM